MRLGVNYAFTGRDQLRSGTVNHVDTLSQRTESHLVSMAASYGLTDKVSVTSSLPFIINRSVSRSLDQTVSSFGDLSILAQYAVSQEILSEPANIRIAIGATVPVGGGVTNVATDETNFASGTIDPLASFVMAFGLVPGWNLTGKFFTRQVISTSSGGQRSGDQYVYGLDLNFAPLGRSYTINSGLSFINRGQDVFDGLPFDGSGGDWIYALLGGSKVIWSKGESNIRLWGEFQIPLYIYVNGFQLTDRWNLRFGLTTGIPILGHESEPENGLLKQIKR